MFNKVLATTAILGVLAVFTYAQKPQVSAERLASEVQKALDSRPDNNPLLVEPAAAGVQLLDIQINQKRKEIVLNLSQQLLNYGLGSDLEVVLEHILSGVDSAKTGWAETNYKILVDGIPLSDVLKFSDEQMIAHVGQESANLEWFENLGSGSLSGKRIVISPGHGWYWHPTLGWQLQRPYKFGIVEDFVNAEMVMYLNSELSLTGADLRPTRNLNKNAGNGETGHARWEESAKYHIKAQGAPASVYSSTSVISDYDKDITSRPLYANYVNGNILVSVHNNAGGGTGSETWYDTGNGQQTESKRLATLLHNKVVAAIRQQYNNSWKDRGVIGCNGCKGENRIATRPAVILEVAFTDTEIPDNKALRDEKFKQLVARAIKQGIEEYYGVTSPVGTFSLSATPFTATIKQGSTTSFNLAVKSSSGFSSPVSLAAKNLPGNRVLSGTGWQPTSVTPAPNGTAYSNFILVTDTGTPTGTFTITLQGTSGGVIKETTVQLTVSAAQTVSLDQQAQTDMRNAAQRDSRFGSAISGSFGVDRNWDPSWELRWMDFYFTQGRVVRMYHATSKSNSSYRLTSFWNPDTGQWTSWQQAY